MLEAKNLSVGYNGRYLIKKVNLSFEPGKIYAVIGKNGCGKSRLLQKCAGQLPTGGSVLLDGENLAGVALGAVAKRISYAPTRRYSRNMTVERLMMQSRQTAANGQKKLSEEDWKQVYHALGAMKAVGLIDLPIAKLSDGERQRIEIAMQLAQDADYVLMDEPTRCLDPEFRLVFLQQLLRMKAAGKTVIMATHDLDMAVRYSDELIAIDLGREVHVGTPEKLTNDGILKKIFQTDIVLH